MESQFAVYFVRIGIFFLSMFFGVVSVVGIVICVYESIERKYRKWLFDNRKFDAYYFNSALLSQSHYSGNGHDRHEIHHSSEVFEDKLDA